MKYEILSNSSQNCLVSQKHLVSSTGGGLTSIEFEMKIQDSIIL